MLGKPEAHLGYSLMDVTLGLFHINTVHLKLAVARLTGLKNSDLSIFPFIGRNTTVDSMQKGVHTVQFSQ